jgi:hypothetical protein
MIKLGYNIKMIECKISKCNNNGTYHNSLECVGARRAGISRPEFHIQLI